MTSHGRRRIVALITTFPSRGQTFIAQEFVSLKRQGFEIEVRPLLRSNEGWVQPMAQQMQDDIVYSEAGAISKAAAGFKAWRRWRNTSGYKAALKLLKARPTPFNLWLFYKALILAENLNPDRDIIYAHFIRHPAQISQFASLLSGTPWACCAHARDIWLSSDNSLRAKLQDVHFVATCTGIGAKRMKSLSQRPDSVKLIYHGLDSTLYPINHGRQHTGSGQSATQAVKILTVGRAVEKKRFDLLLKALAELPASLHWMLLHVGTGPRIPKLKALAKQLGIEDRVEFAGFRNSTELLELYRESEVFALPCRVDNSGDMDGLPNVSVEAASQAMACILTTISAIPEFFTSEENGILVEPEDVAALASAFERMIKDPALRQRLGTSAAAHIKNGFDHATNMHELIALFDSVPPTPPPQNLNGISL